ncbi:MAG TPA: hypothetical protein VKE92_04985 [Anaerolineales bacterium]|nr:hypothetical protein [Anaerolineales bacterium]
MYRASAPGYDRFKSVVTAILVVILILMLLRGCATNAVSPAPAENTIVPNATEIITEAVAASNTAALSSPSPAPPTATATLVPADTPVSAPASPTPTIAAAASTPTSAVAATATPVQAQGTSCDTSVPSRLSVGQTARVVTRLNMRNDSSIKAALLQTNPTNTQVEIIGGPVCEPVEDRAYLWWQIRLPDGVEGWSAETQLNNPSYFLEPIP